jgi:hypothetical protein
MIDGGLGIPLTDLLIVGRHVYDEKNPSPTVDLFAPDRHECIRGYGYSAEWNVLWRHLRLRIDRTRDCLQW